MNECIACGLNFLSVEAFDIHRVGPTDYCYVHNSNMGPKNHPEEDDDGMPLRHAGECRWKLHPKRRCLTPAEIAGKGLVRNEKGDWGTKEGIEARAASSVRMAKARAARGLS